MQKGTLSRLFETFGKAWSSLGGANLYAGRLSDEPFKGGVVSTASKHNAPTPRAQK